MEMRYYQIIKELSLRNLKLKYASTTLGILWAGLSPLILTLAIYFVFIKIWGIESKGFALFVLSGIVPWLYFSSAVMESTQAFIQEKSMLSQFDFPRVFYPLAINTSNLFQHLIAWAFVLPFFVLEDIRILPKVPLLILPVLCFWIFLNGVCIISAVINLLFRDFQHLLSTGLMIFFWFTPVFYSLDMVPHRYRIILYLNPLTYFFKIYRAILLKIVINKWEILVVLVMMVFSLFLSWYIYKKLYRKIEKKI